MTIEPDRLRAELRAILASPAIGLPEYEADPVIKRRLGAMIVKAVQNGASRQQLPK